MADKIPDISPNVDETMKAYASIPIGTVLMLLTSVEVVLKSVEELKGVGAA